MLTKLTVENYALIDRLDLELSDSLNIITGETGAGKSILLGALSLLLGGRADAAVIMDGERNCVVEGSFSLDGYNLEAFFEENDLEFDVNSTVRRVITPAGKSRAYINDLPVQQTTLKELGARLIDIHSQHQSLMIANDSFRTNIIDSVAAHRELLEQYKEKYNTLRSTERELTTLRTRANESRKDEEYTLHQLEQLTSAALKEGEQAELEAEQNELSHSELIRESLGASTLTLDTEVTGILPQLKAIELNIGKLTGVYPKAKEIHERIRSTVIELKDLYGELSEECERIESNPERLMFISERLNTIYSLQQKHKVSSVEELIELREQYSEKLAAITGSDEAIVELEAKIVKLQDQTLALGAKITKGRLSAASKVEKYSNEILEKLGLPNGKLVVSITSCDDLRPSGVDNIAFLFSANKNIAPQPLEKVASGGEISRVMLTLKSLVAKSVKLPTIIFDEIDTGVSGRIADAMGDIITELSQSMQVVNITHLPQVAAKGDTHFFVYKDDSGKASRTLIAKLSPDKRIEEIAKMISGSAVTPAAIEQAKYLLRNI